MGDILMGPLVYVGTKDNPENGRLFFNYETKKYEVYINNEWHDLDDNTVNFNYEPVAGLQHIETSFIVTPTGCEDFHIDVYDAYKENLIRKYKKN